MEQPRLRNLSRFSQKPRHLPPWLKKRLSLGHDAGATDALIADLELNTICKSGHCPNRNECYSQKTATFMVMGNVCTRNCHYCSVLPGKPAALDHDEPARVAEAIKRLDLKHAVITSVTRDDLPDEGLAHLTEVVRQVRTERPATIVEVLTPDFRRDPQRAAEVIAAWPIEIFNHNIETVRRIHKSVRPQGGYDLSLGLLDSVHQLNPKMIIKSGAMLGLGEEINEVEEMINDLRSNGCQMLTLGQYLQPDQSATEVKRYVTPEEFDSYKTYAVKQKFDLVESGPFVRSSYHAKDSFIKLESMIFQNKD